MSRISGSQVAQQANLQAASSENQRAESEGNQPGVEGKTSNGMKLRTARPDRAIRMLFNRSRSSNFLQNAAMRLGPSALKAGKTLAPKVQSAGANIAKSVKDAIAPNVDKPNDALAAQRSPEEAIEFGKLSASNPHLAATPSGRQTLHSRAIINVALNQKIDNADFQAQQKGQQILDIAGDELGNVYFEPSAIRTQAEKLSIARLGINSSLDKLLPLQGDTIKGDPIIDELIENLNTALGEIDDAIGPQILNGGNHGAAATSRLGQTLDEYVLSEAEVAHGFDLWDRTSELVLGELSGRGPDDNALTYTPPARPEGVAASEGEAESDIAYKGSLKELGNVLGGKKLLKFKGPETGYKSDSIKQIKAQLADAGITVDSKTIKEAMKEQRLHVMNNEQVWETIDKPMLYVDQQGGRHNFSSKQIPANTIIGIEKTQYSNTADGSSTGGFCAYSNKSEHVNNLFNSTLVDAGGKEIFSGIRHGAFCAYAEKSPSQRTAKNLNRAQETVAAAVMTQVHAGKIDLAALIAASTGGEVPTITMSSISLLTPDAFRNIGIKGHGLKGSSDDERSMLRDQFAAWDGVGNQPQTLSVVDPTTQQPVQIKVNVNVMAFNFGVSNETLQPATWKKALGLTERGNWSELKNKNTESMNKLMDATSQYIETHPGDADLQVVRDLQEQVYSIFHDESYQKVGNEAYKLQARIAVLTDKIGGTPCFNCKSGKDRTGMLDAEAKNLASDIAANGRVPDADHKLTDIEKQNVSHYAAHSGQMEIQKLQAGVGGTKGGGLNTIKNRILNSNAMQAIKAAASAASN